MCMGGGGSAPETKPLIPPPKPPKMQNMTPLLQKRNAAPTGPDTVANGTLLTGGAGVPPASLNLGGNTLLGGGDKK